jgi:hypothetical protein
VVYGNITPRRQASKRRSHAATVKLARRKEQNKLRREWRRDRANVQRQYFDVQTIVFTVLAVAFVVAWALDL